ncbi:hypothetical protein ACIRQF_00040 [Streptomyces sp. NPDC101191]|uniref:hypothetical protein n=1 Tax=Streptomyces sp. NPDC101191 TaxID=3366126 RepID=UPI00381CB4D8
MLALEMAHDAEPLIQDAEGLAAIDVPSGLGIAAVFADTSSLAVPLPGLSSLAAVLADTSSLAAAITQQNAAMNSLISSVAIQPSPQH